MLEQILEILGFVDMTGHPARSLKPRKIPVQERSMRTWRFILEAAAQVFAEHGYEGTSTNLIAERAGFSVGTIYEYFPNKDVLLSELQSHWSDVCWDYLQNLPEEDSTLPLEQRIRSMFEVWVSVLNLNRVLYSALLDDLPTRGNKWKADERFNERVTITQRELANYVDQLRVTDIALTCEILIRGVQAYLNHLVVTDPEKLDDPRLVDDLTHQFCEFVLLPKGP